MYVIVHSPRGRTYFLHPATAVEQVREVEEQTGGGEWCEKYVGIQTGWAQSTQTPTVIPILLRWRFALGPHRSPHGGIRQVLCSLLSAAMRSW